MSDQSPPPPKPKPGSLRDRIAAFEKSASAAVPTGPAPAPRPKPAGFASWKPKAPSPPDSPSAGSTDHAASSPRVGGMSASDAKESITKAGSLKDRMAALQGKGAFGAPPPVAPKPAVERPKWKPPPVVQASADDDDHPGASETVDIAAAVETTTSPPVSVKSGENLDTAKGPEDGPEPAAPAAGSVGDNEGPSEADPEEEERQRRAAIAARMARLGGARVGMAPPVFGKKPPVRRPTQEDVPKPDESPKSDEHAPEAAKSMEVQSPQGEPSIVASPPTEALQEQAEANARQSSEYFPARKNSENASLLSTESTGSQPARSPSSMPIPAVPRRSGPPRKKPAKAVPPPPLEVAEEIASPAVASKDATKDFQVATEEAEPVFPEVQEEVKELTEEAVEPKPLDDLQQEIPHETAAEKETAGVSTEEQEPESFFSEAGSSSLPLTKEPLEIMSPPRATEAEEVEEAEDEVEIEESEAFAASASPVLPSSPKQASHDDEGHCDTAAVTAAPNVPEEDDEAEEEARKKRVAERLAKMGGINPFAPPPPQVRSPPQPAQSPPALPAVEQHEPQLEPPSSHEGVHTIEEENVVESTAEEEDFDEDEVDEDDVRDDRPIVTGSEPERPVTPTLPHSEPRRQSVDFKSRPPPVPPAGTRPPIPVQQDEEEDDEASDYGDAESEQDRPAPAPPHRPLSVSEHPPIVSSPRESAREADVPFPPARPAQPPRRIVPQAPEPAEDGEDEEEAEEEEMDEEADERLATSQLFVPPPSGRGPIAIPRHVQAEAEAEEDGDGSENDVPALPVPHRRSMEIPPGRLIPPPPPVHRSFNEDSEPESDHDGQALPIPPRHSSNLPPRLVPPPPPSQMAAPHPPPVLRDIPPAPPRLNVGLSSASPEHLTPTVSISGSEEILDEEEGDPIDPVFHSPSRRTSFASIHAMAQAQSQESSSDSQIAEKISPPPVQSPPPAISKVSSEETEQPAEDAEQLRRKTIAERMAKLGGIRFGATPPTPASRPPPPIRHQEEQEEAENAPAAEDQQAAAPSEEEEERARKERIAAKLATMGGMRIGMMPMGVGGLPPQRSHVLREEISNPPPPPVGLSSRAVPPARPPPPPAPTQPYPDTDSEYESAAASDDGVQIEAEESEMEEVGYSDAQEEHEEEAPPPVPSRFGRAPSRQVSVDKPTSPIAPPIPSPRPPVPTAMPARRSSVQTSRSSTSNSGLDSSVHRKSSAFMPPTQSEYVMVEEPEQQEAPPLPPPARPTSRVPPMRSTPQVPPAMTTSRTSDAHEWELPSIPTSNLDFGEGADLSLSWTDAGELASPTTSAPPPPPTAKRPSLPPAPAATERQLSPDDLITLWGRVGVQVCEAATTLFERSKKSLIGDGTYVGFVRSVLAAVPNAASFTSQSSGYGYLIYAQNGGSVQKRVSEIMPGDIVEIHDAKFKGHKGLQTYHQNVGGAGGEVLVGVVGEVEAKKSKIRVFQANQHVGQQTVESVSYRLEDLKSGIVRVYRVLDA